MDKSAHHKSVFPSVKLPFLRMALIKLLCLVQKIDPNPGSYSISVSCLKVDVPVGNEQRLSEYDKLTECLHESAIKNFPGRRIRIDMSD